LETLKRSWIFLSLQGGVQTLFLGYSLDKKYKYW
jgi:hypothetical protein